ncbi:MAG: heavy metal-associated domain-containing protein [Candidatus Eisenbacteria bacterium]
MGSGNRSIRIILIVLILSIGAGVVFAPSWFGSDAEAPETVESEERAPAAAVRTVVLDVSGMHCSGCEHMIKTSLEKTPGVVSADVSLEEARAVVALSTHDDIEGALLAAVAAAGYTAVVAD